MVGLVLVSHSYRLAEGTAELARQMGGDEVRIEIAAGLDTPDHEIGTDAMLVSGAIERVWSEDGVLVLMDLGSAVLSAEMALDLLPSTIDRGRIRLIEAPFVEGAVAAAVTARIGDPLERVVEEARAALASKAAHLGVGPMPADAPATDGPAAVGPVVDLEVDVGIEHGLHARPAAALVRTASAFDADVRVTNVTTGRGDADARSLNSVATLGVRRGDRIRVRASGPDAAEVVAAIRALADRHFDEAPSPADADGVAPRSNRSPEATSGELHGVPASPGVAVGPVVRFRPGELEVPPAPSQGVETELVRLDTAVRETVADIQRQRAAMVARAGASDVAIFDAHLLLLTDDALLVPARDAIAQGETAATAWARAVGTVVATWDAIDDDYQRARAADVRSIGTQVLARILDVVPPLPRLERPGILVAADLSPAEAAALDPSTVLGVATAFGGATAHAALIARSVGIPAVVGLGEPVLAIAEGTIAALDADAGVFVAEPLGDVVHALDARRRARDEDLAHATVRAHEPAITLDGTTIEIAANIGSPAEAAAAIERGADGVGLFRTEFLFLDRPTLPDEDEQEAAYRAAAEALGGRPMIVRTLDVGADKPIRSLPQPAEANPFLGVRGIRLGLARPDLLETQLRAILRVAVDHRIRLMFPMVSILAEVRAGRAALERARAALFDRGIAVPERVEVGVMIEVPSAAVLADRLADEVDFFSIGTNDLTQYTLAADRGNEHVAPLADAVHPAVLDLIGRTCAAAEASGRWVGICGELAGDPAATSLLLGLGVRELSVGPPAIGPVKRAVRATDLGKARDLAERGRRLDSAEAVRALLRER